MPEPGNMDPLANATLVNDPSFSEIVPGGALETAGGQGAPQPGQPAASLKQDEGHALVSGLDAPSGQQPQAPAEKGEDLPEYIQNLPEPALPPEPGAEGEEIVLDEITQEDEAFIQAAQTEEEYKARLQQVKKRIHDVNSARIGRLKAELQKRSAEAQAIQRLLEAGGVFQNPPASGDTPTAPQTRPVDAGNAFDPRQLPEYHAMMQAKQARDQAADDPEKYWKMDEAYEAAREAYLEAKLERKLLASKMEAERAKQVEQAYEVDRRLDQEWKGDLIRPIPWADLPDGSPGVKSLFRQLAQRDPSLPLRNPHTDPVERAKWMAQVVAEHFPRAHAIHLERVRAGLMRQRAAKTAAAPVQSGQTSPLKGQQKPGPGDVTSAFLNYINQGQP